MHTRLLYVMDPMCSWCWGFAPVLQALAEQAAACGVPLELVVGGLRQERAALDPAGRVRILGHWQAVNAMTGQLFNFHDGLPRWPGLSHRAGVPGAGHRAPTGWRKGLDVAAADPGSLLL